MWLVTWYKVWPLKGNWRLKGHFLGIPSKCFRYHIETDTRSFFEFSFSGGKTVPKSSLAAIASILIMWPYTSHVCSLANQIWRIVTRLKAVRFRGLSIWILRPRWKVNIMKGFMNLLVKSGCRDFHSQDEPRRERESQKRIIGRAPRPPRSRKREWWVHLRL